MVVVLNNADKVRCMQNMFPNAIVQVDMDPRLYKDTCVVFCGEGTSLPNTRYLPCTFSVVHDVYRGCTVWNQQQYYPLHEHVSLQHFIRDFMAVYA